MENKLWVLAVSLTFGCTGISSTQIGMTSEIHADLSARSIGAGSTTVKGILTRDRVDGLQYVGLDGNYDGLFASVNGGRKLMMAPHVVGGTIVVAYTVEFNTDAEGDTFEIELRLGVDGGVSTLPAVATLPVGFTLNAVPASAKRSEPLTLSWPPSRSTDPMKWSATGTCIGSSEGMITNDGEPDPGSVTIPANFIKKGFGNNLPDMCVMSIALTRSRIGNRDPKYASDSIILSAQDRTVSLTSTP